MYAVGIGQYMFNAKFLMDMQPVTEGTGVLAIGDLSDDRVDVVPASEVLLQRVLLDLLLGHDSVVAASMARGAVRREDVCAVLQVRGHGWAPTRHSGKEAEGQAESERVPGRGLLRLLRRLGCGHLLPHLSSTRV